jgi:DNA-binding NtrC family response regulator
MSAAVLVVQDEPSVRRLLRRMFEADGLQIIEATSARQAVQLFAKHNNDIGVVVCGLRLSGLSGETLVKVLRNIDAVVRVFIFSAIEPDFQLPDGVQAFPKPKGLNDLRQAVCDAILG